MLTSRDAEAVLVRLRSGDPTAPSDLVVAYLDELARWLKDRNPAASAEDCLTAAEDALLALIKNPTSYDPRQASLQGYLRMCASGDLKNRWRAEQRHVWRKTSLEDVELSSVEGKYLVDEEADPAQRLEVKERSQMSVKAVGALQARLSPKEQKLMDLMLNGERKTRVYAEALGLSGLSASEQAREVKRVKDRLKKRLERIWGKERP